MRQPSTYGRWDKGRDQSGRRQAFQRCFRHLLGALFLLALIPQLGCSRVSSLRSRWFGRPEATVPPPELGMTSPELGRVEPDRAAGRGSKIGGLPRSAAWQTVGRSVENRPIQAMVIGSGPSRVMLIGGIHGDEPEGLPLIERLTGELAADRSLAQAATILIVRDLNPDGTAAQTRTNKNGVDLNRNFPANNWDSSARQLRFHPGPKPGSEPETQVLVGLMNEFQPERILVMHSTRGKPMVNYDGPARSLAESLSGLNGYVTSDTIGYPTPGSLGSYAGIDMKIPIITLELPRGIGAEEAWRANREALHQFIR